MRLAILSDIHGNLMALEAVLADVARQGVDAIWCLGDIANLGPFPAECIDRVHDACDVVIQGNHELYVLGQKLPDDWQTCPTFDCLRWTRRQLRPDQFDFIAHLPLRVDLPHETHPAVAVHAAPIDQFTGISARHSDDEVAEAMAGLEPGLLFCGHTHIAMLRRWSNSWIVNPGSVGMPIDGAPGASYLIAERARGGWQFGMRRLTYDMDALMNAFDSRGLQKVGRMVTAVFRYQFLTGKERISPYLGGLERKALALGVAKAAIYERYPMPDDVPLAWVANGEATNGGQA